MDAEGDTETEGAAEGVDSVDTVASEAGGLAASIDIVVASFTLTEESPFARG